jgi:hypothetical protein
VHNIGTTTDANIATFNTFLESDIKMAYFSHKIRLLSTLSN